VTETITIKRITTHVYRCPLDTPVVTSFGTMRDRPMVLVEVEDQDGGKGIGEVWCNFPSVGAEHRARLVQSVIEPLLTSRSFASPAEAFQFLSAQTAVLAIQTGEFGPFAQVIAGVDIALWDLVARRAGLPLFRHLERSASPTIGIYASGLNPTAPERLAAERFAEGYRAFKLKVGFGSERDLRNLAALRDRLGGDVRLMVDANQGWDLPTAKAMLAPLAEFDLDWLEEPLRADRPWDEWRVLADEGRVRLAAGENITSTADFDKAIASGVLAVLQPDVAKWGGISACMPVARAIRTAGLRYCPHYLGGGVGLLASAHLLAAIGGDGLLEIDANPNPLRTILHEGLLPLARGTATLTEKPGLGVESLEGVAEFERPW
jgi:D-galactarolactone cycloisomerase